MRKAHYLRANQKSETVSQFICFDTETHPEVTAQGRERDHLTFGWACYQRSKRKGQWCAPEWFRFETPEQFWRWVKGKARPSKTLYMFCHNTNYDLPVVSAFRVARRMGFKLRMAILDGPPTIIKWTHGSATIKCLDTLNFWRFPLKNIGEMIGHPKMEMPAPDASPEKWDEYGKNDVEILRLALIAWWAFLVENDLGNFRPTLASQALGTYKHRFMPTQMLVHEREAALDMERASYHGGRCECFYIGKRRGRFYLVDVNSMYPAVMKAHLYPAKIHWQAKDPSLRLLRSCLISHCVVADVTLKTEQPAYAVVRGNKLVFPVGTFRATLTTEELRLADGSGELLECHALTRYSAEPCFSEFVGWMYAQRLKAASEGNSVRSWQFKILMNSLYGKFGQTGRVWAKLRTTEDETTRTWAEVDMDAGRVRRYRQIAGLIQSFEEQSESFESMPAIAAHICANARLLLWRYIQAAGRDHVYYCDTDSLLVDLAGYRRLKPFIDATELGKLKREYYCREVEIWGPKDYRFGDKIRHKGIRGQAEQLSENTWKQWQWSSLVGMLRSGCVDHPTRKMVTKTLKRNYDKGVIEVSSRVTPLRISSDAPLLT